MRTCVVCGVGIEGRPSNHLTCSKPCSNTRRKEDNVRRLARYRAANLHKRSSDAEPRTCLHCGASIEGRHPNAKTCSTKCYKRVEASRLRQATQTALGDRQCRMCGGSLFGLHHLATFCSDGCRRNHRREYSKSRYINDISGERTKKAEYHQKNQSRRSQYSRQYRQKNADALLEKKQAYREANRDRLKQAEKDRLERHGELIRKRARDRYHERRAAIKLIREIQTKGIEALL